MERGAAGGSTLNNGIGGPNMVRFNQGNGGIIEETSVIILNLKPPPLVENAERFYPSGVLFIDRSVHFLSR